MGNRRGDLQWPLKQERFPIATADGTFSALYSKFGLAELFFPESDHASEVLGETSNLQWHHLTCAALRSILAGKAPEELPPFDLAFHSSFRQAVWAELRKLRPGQTISYGELAQVLGKPGAARAVGNACGANPIPLLIPCHRVLGAGRALGGFSGGLEWKRKLLLREGIIVTDRAVAELPGSAQPLAETLLLNI